MYRYHSIPIKAGSIMLMFHPQASLKLVTLIGGNVPDYRGFFLRRVGSAALGAK